MLAPLCFHHSPAVTYTICFTVSVTFKFSINKSSLSSNVVYSCVILVGLWCELIRRTGQRTSATSLQCPERYYY